MSRNTPHVIAPPTDADVPTILDLVEPHVSSGALLPRSAASIRAHLDDWLVARDAKNDEVIAVVSLHRHDADLAEIRTLAVRAGREGQGVGADLLAGIRRVAYERGIPRVFAFSRSPRFFERGGFQALPPASVRRWVPSCRTPREGQEVLAWSPHRTGELAS